MGSCATGIRCLSPSGIRCLSSSGMRCHFQNVIWVDIEKLSQAWQYSVDVFFDVGAHNGETIQRARNRFKNCKITAFEPHPKTFLKLRENMKEATNVDLVNLALGSECGDK